MSSAWLLGKSDPRGIRPELVGKEARVESIFTFRSVQKLGEGQLTFRHQAHGSADQGIGATGLQVWNVDLSDFALASEVGGVTYCSPHWNAGTRTLSYTVVDATDELQGRTGTLQFSP